LVGYAEFAFVKLLDCEVNGLSFDSDWNNVIRRVIFKSDELLTLMMIPSGDRTNIKKFIDSYFIESAQTGE